MENNSEKSQQKEPVSENVERTSTGTSTNDETFKSTFKNSTSTGVTKTGEIVKISKKELRKLKAKQDREKKRKERQAKKDPDAKGYICTYPGCEQEFKIWKNTRAHMEDAHDIKKPKLKKASELYKNVYRERKKIKDEINKQKKMDKFEKKIKENEPRPEPTDLRKKPDEFINQEPSVDGLGEKVYKSIKKGKPINEKQYHHQERIVGKKSKYEKKKIMKVQEKVLSRFSGIETNNPTISRFLKNQNDQQNEILKKLQNENSDLRSLVENLHKTVKTLESKIDNNKQDVD